MESPSQPISPAEQDTDAESQGSGASKVSSHDLAANLTGDFEVLKKYLDNQFARQEELISNLSFHHSLDRRSHPRAPSPSGPAAPPASPLAPVPEQVAKPDLRQMYSALSKDSSGSITDRLQVQFDSARRVANSVTSGVSMASTVRSASRRKSARKSFVRGALNAQEEKARKAGARLMAVRDTVSKAATIESETWQGRLQRFVQSSFFTNFIMLLIMGNAVLLGVEIDVSATVGQNDVPIWFGVVNTVLVFIFTAETTLKLLALGCHEFWRGDEAVWNCFDFVIVSLSVMETILDWWAQTMSSSADGSNSFRIMRALRLARTLRGVRIIRLFRYFSALRGLILSIFSTMGSLLWTLLLLLILFYTFSCIFAQVVTDYCRYETIVETENLNAVPVCPSDLGHYWGNVMDSMMTLFMSITGGINWEDAYTPMKKVSVVALGLMNLYIVIGFFTILNVVTGVFVNTAIESASADKDLATLKQMQKRVENMSSLQEVFQEMDHGDINAVSLDDLEAALQLDKLGTFLESLGISTDDAWSLFMLIDADHDGLVDMDEFVNGCMQLRGPAKGLQLAKMAYENKLTRQAIKHLHDDVATISRHVKQSMKYRLVREAI